MKSRKRILSLLILVLALSLVAFVWLPSKTVTIKEGQTRDIAIGRMGVHISNSYHSGTIRVSQKSTDPAAKGLRLVAPIRFLDARFNLESGARLTKITGSVYVFFNLRRVEAAAFNNEHIGIFYFDPWFNEWRECSSYKIGGLNSRVACTITNYGLYALAWK